MNFSVFNNTTYPVYTGNKSLTHQKDYSKCIGDINFNRLHCTSIISNNLQQVKYKTYCGLSQKLEFDRERINYFIEQRYISICDFYKLYHDDTIEHILYVEEIKFQQLFSEITISQYDIIKIPCKFIYIERIVSYNNFPVLNRQGKHISDKDLNFDITSLMIVDGKFCYHDNTLIVTTPPPQRKRTIPPPLQRPRRVDDRK